MQLIVDTADFWRNFLGISWNQKLNFQPNKVLSQKKSRSNQKKKIVVKLTGLTLKKLRVRLKINPKLMATIKMAPIALLVTKKKKQQTVGLSNTRFFKDSRPYFWSNQTRRRKYECYLKKPKLSRILKLKWRFRQEF